MSSLHLSTLACASLLWNIQVVAINDLKKDKNATIKDKELLEQFLMFQQDISGHVTDKYSIFKDLQGNVEKKYDILDDTSVLRLSQMLNCDYFIVSTLTSYNQNKKSFKVQRSSPELLPHAICNNKNK